ncbi:Exonuclease_family protein [Hexamita inflata]|uniref:Exonuclease family protein n=1 Tax=Hexamita inflata TaxID=28002 RepID=A0AA86QBJ0_9EUKA|nr:Exonuclease family protein [Hexamita inflata]
MGFHGLSHAIGKQITTKHFANKNVAVDGYNLLYSLKKSCADAMSTGNLDKIVKHYGQLLRSLIESSAFTYLVWDGQRLPAKSIVSVPRFEAQQKALKDNFAQFQETNQNDTNLLEQGFFVDTNEVKIMNQKLENMFQKKFKAFIAPFECDYQLAWMHQQKVIYFVISNDNDLVLFGIPLVRHFDGANGELITVQDLNIEGSVQDYVIQMILNGSDYYPYKCGLAYNAGKFNFNGDPGENGTLDKCIQALITALMVMRYQMILDLRTKKLEHWQPFLKEDLQFVQFLPKNVLGYVSKDIIALSQNTITIENKSISVRKDSIVQMLKMQVNTNKIKLPGINQQINLNQLSIYEEYLMDCNTYIQKRWAYSNRFKAEELSEESE